MKRKVKQSVPGHTAADDADADNEHRMDVKACKSLVKAAKKEVKMTAKWERKLTFSLHYEAFPSVCAPLQ